MSHFAAGNLELERYPPDHDPSLQAWDAADEYLIRELETSGLPSQGPILIFNDGFGALTCWLHARAPICVSDSYLSQEACRRNLVRNDLPGTATLQDPLAALPAAPQLVIIKIPKTLALLEQQLLALRQVVTPATRILAAGKARDIHTSTLQLFERLLGATHTSLAWKKARLIHCQVADLTEPMSNPYPSIWPLEGTGYHIHNHANVFSRASLDIGARFFLQHLPTGCQGTIADLGCGNGVLGLMVLEQNPDARVLFVDESHMALASSRLNVHLNRPDDMARCEFRLDNCLEGQPAQSLGCVLCNPPFHQQQAVTDHIAWQMIRDAHRSLERGGELRLIGNRHLGYHVKLKRLFRHVECLASNSKFVILRAIKP